MRNGDQLSILWKVNDFVKVLRIGMNQEKRENI